MRQAKSREVAQLGLLFALALALSFLENMVVAALLLPPGIKLGLANVVVLFCILIKKRREAVVLVFLKSLLALFTRGAFAAVLSACGGFASLLLMLFLLQKKNTPSVMAISVWGAIVHSFAQLLLFSLLLGGSYVWVYAPVMLVAALLAGGVNAMLVRLLLPALVHIGFVQTKKNIKSEEKKD